MTESLKDYGQVSPIIVCELEEAWIIYALVREDGLQQSEAATMLGRHKSWNNRQSLRSIARELNLTRYQITRIINRTPKRDAQAASEHDSPPANLGSAEVDPNIWTTSAPRLDRECNAF